MKVRMYQIFKNFSKLFFFKESMFTSFFSITLEITHSTRLLFNYDTNDALDKRKWYKKLVNFDMIKILTRKINKKFKANDMREWEKFVNNFVTFYNYQFVYFNLYNHHKVLEIAQHFDNKLMIKWQNYNNALSQLLTWNEFIEWLKQQIINSQRVTR